jgi:hypothetical protein
MATQSLEFKSDLDDTQFQAGLKNMEKGGKRVEGSLVGSFSSMAKSIGSSMAAAFTVQAVVGAAKSLLDFVGQLQDQAEALGVSTEKLQGLQGAMSQSGVSAEKFTKGMATLNQSIEQAKNDTGTARDSFEALGITFANIANDSPDELILKIADGLKNAKDPAAAFSAALDLLGKNNINFVAGLKAGRDEVDKLANSIEKISKEDVALLAAAGDSIEQFGTKVKVSAINGALGLSKYKEQIKSIGLIAAAATGQLDPFLKIIAAAEGFFGDSKGTPSPATNEPKPEYLGPEYTPPAPVVEDPRVKKAREEEEKRIKELRDFEAQQYRQFTSGKQSEAEKFAEEEKKRIKELSDFEAEQYRQFTSGKQQADAKAAEDNKKQKAKDAVEQAGKTLQQAQKDTAQAQQNTNDARQSLANALSGNADPRETSQDRRVSRLINKAEGPQMDKQEPMKIGKVGGGTALDEKKPGALSTKRGVGKALKELQDTKKAEDAARKAEKKAEQQQEDMVTALQAINKGINGN